MKNAMININSINIQKDIITIFGATASGKSDIALNLAQETGGVIINADSSQIYKEAPTLSNLPSNTDFKTITHELFAYLSIMDDSSVIDWLQLCASKIKECREQKKLPIIVGGSGFYISSLLYGITDIPSSKENKEIAINVHKNLGNEEFYKMMQEIDPLLVAKTNDSQRLIRSYEVYLCSQKPLSYYHNIEKRKYIEGNFINIYLNPKRKDLYEKINQRTLQMIKNGAIQETEKILQITNKDAHLKKILGLKELSDYLNNNITLNQTIENIQQKTRNYAKRQITWFNNQITDKNIFVNNNVFCKK